MSIVVVNDNTRRLAVWEKVLNPHRVKSFSHPNSLLSAIYKDPSSFCEVKTYIFDRIFYGEDLLKTDQLQKIRMACPQKDAVFFLSSAHHEPGEEISGFDRVISFSPSPIEDFMAQV